ncbi:MAG: FliG C-terminal domain-containing protein [Planctomycetota bacterium]|nr:FliG C-terminal domain-containing protein [Planctomycetota bacterium]
MGDKHLKGPDKVAAFLLSLDEVQATAVLKHLPDHLVGEIAEAMTKLDPNAASEDRIHSLFRDIATRTNVRGPVRPQRPSEMRAMLADTFGEGRAEKVIQDIDTRNRREFPFRNVAKYAPPSIAAVLRHEAPAVAAVVLAHLEPAMSAAVLSAFDEEQSIEVVRGMTNMVPPGFETLQAIAQDVESQLDGAIAISSVDTSRQLKTVAELLNFSGADLEQSVLAGIEAENEDKAKEIKEYMFTWDDLAGVEKRAMQKILGSVNTRTLSIALKASLPDVEQNIMANLSSRVRGMVAEERELAGPVAMSEVDLMRAEVMDAVRALMESGEFRPAKSGEDLVT